MTYPIDPIVEAFKDGTLELKGFNHRKHLYLAWVYLKVMPYDTALDLYATNLYSLLEAAGQTEKYDFDLTERYFYALHMAMVQHPASDFESFMDEGAQEIEERIKEVGPLNPFSCSGR